MKAIECADKFASRKGEAKNRFNFFYSLALLLFICLQTVSTVIATEDADSMQVVAGRLDLSQWDLQREPRLVLGGEWLVSWANLVDPAEVPHYFAKHESNKDSFHQVPGTWDTTPEITSLPGQFSGYGFASYIVRIDGYRSDAGSFALTVPYISSSHEIYIVHEHLPKSSLLLSSLGKAGASVEEYKPKVGVYTVNIPVEVDGSFFLLIRISNFLHARGGFSQPISLGVAENLHFWTDIKLLMDVFFLGIIFVVMLNSYSVFRHETSERGSLYLSFISFVAFLRVLATQYLFERFSGLPPEVAFQLSTKVSYLTTLWAAGPVVSYCYFLFPNHISQVVVRVGWIVSVCYTLFVIFATTAVVSYYLLELQVVLMSIGVYILVAVIRAAKDGVQYARMFLFALVPLMLSVVHDVFESRNLGLGTFITHYAFALVLYLQSQIMRIKANDRALETQRRVTAAEVESKAKSQFLATMSHEIRTPMNGVLGMAELLEEMPLEPRAKEYVSIISGSGKALLHLINDILDYSKIEAGKMELEQVTVDLDELIFECLSVFSLNAERKGVELMTRIDPTVDLTVKTDPTRLRQIILNLLGNALKFTEKGHVLLKVSETKKSMGHAEIKFEICDSGIGISEEGQERLFKSFTQVSSATSRQFGGTGLGLSISKKLSELMGGEIGVESKEGEGSNFWFTIQVVSCKETTFMPLEPLLQGRRMAFLSPSQFQTDFVLTQGQLWGMDIFATCDEEEFQQRLTASVHQNETFDLVAVHRNYLKNNAEVELDTLVPKSIRAHSQLILVAGILNGLSEEDWRILGFSLSLQMPTSIARLKRCLVTVLNPAKGELHVSPNEVEAAYEAKYSGRRVLVAEDNSVNQIVIKAMLAQFGIEPDIVEDGQLALHAVENAQTPYDLILMDCEMPIMDGYESTRNIRSLEQARGVKVPVQIVALTANIGQETKDLCFSCGMNDYLSKPVEKSAVANILDHYLVA